MTQNAPKLIQKNEPKTTPKWIKSSPRMTPKFAKCVFKNVFENDIKIYQK